MTPTSDSANLLKLVDLVARLRAPDGCPWDRQQKLTDLRAYLLEEAHELAAAIDTEDWGEIQGEMGDLLFQLAFLGRLAQEADAFEPGEAVERIHQKMVARHPHVFGDEELADAEAVRQAWERRKAQEAPAERSLLDGVSSSLPALVGAYRMTQKAAGVGFDWPTPEGCLEKVEEELEEVRQALAESGSGDLPSRALREEIGDLLFTVANLARKLHMDPEAALAATNLKFRHRFRAVEQGLEAQGKALGEATLEEMDELWEGAKRG